MKIAITADCHLTKIEDHPERFNALEDILRQLVELEIQHLIIAGDLFDAEQALYADFDALLSKREFRHFQCFVIPGNHDANIQGRHFGAENLQILHKPSSLRLDPEGPDFLFLPYEPLKSMGESIEPFREDLNPNQWILVGHGDYMEGLRVPNPYEDGTYMPLTSQDLQRYQPRSVFLGHIHVPHERGLVHYPGSPCGMDISETGRRQFTIFDADQSSIERQYVNSDFIFFDETLLMLPIDDEETYIQDLASTKIEAWNLPENLRDKVRLRLKVSGYTRDKKEALKEFKRAFAGYRFLDDAEPDGTDLNLADDPDRESISASVRALIEENVYPSGDDDPSQQEIILASLKILYGDSRR